MNELTTDLLGTMELTSSVTLTDLVLALFISTVLNFALACFYIRTHGGYSYSKSFVQSIVLVGMIVSLIMIIIGSDIARAFALVGAMSIVRFRTPVKDSRDLIFVFAAIAIGMATGTGFYLYAIVFIGFMAAVLFIFHAFKFGDLENRTYVMKLRLASENKDEVKSLCKENCRHFAVVSVTRGGDNSEVEDVVYEVELKPKVAYSDFIERIRERAKPESVNLLVGEGAVNA